MSDPDRVDDTDPTGFPSPDADGDEVTVPNDAPREDAASDQSELDADELLRWLPTLALGHRRRRELVERSSSDGADFAAYACEGRPVATSGRPQSEPAVKVHPPRSADLERDAPTVLTGERRARRVWRTIGWASLGAIAAGTAIAGWTERPAATVKAQRAEAVATRPFAISSMSARSVEAPEPAAPSPATGTDKARTAGDQRPVSSSAAPSDAARKGDSPGAPKPFNALARRRTAPLAAAPTTLPAKDQFFEAP